jgi:hypothetical protein
MSSIVCKIPTLESEYRRLCIEWANRIEETIFFGEKEKEMVQAKEVDLIEAIKDSVIEQVLERMDEEYAKLREKIKAQLEQALT